ncbi:MAG: dihydroorotate dehydrogenase electron transfer subunit [Desulfarculaceae bacterium]|nr:dihydroorotate dehydrogenase electron transfer subunit [Desulfarculaceae bacterium]
MSASLRAKVLANRPVGPGVYLITLKAPAIAAKARPGQFVMLRVSPGAEPLLARPFSIHGVEGESVLVLYQVVGRGTRLLAQAAEGQELVMWGPLGRGFELSGASRPVLVGGGMGIAPLAFAAQRLSEMGQETSLLYGMAGAKGFEPLMETFDARLDPEKVTLGYASEDGSIGLKGLVTALLKETLAQKPGAVLTCGPTPMLKAVATLAREHGAKCQVSLEAPMACGVGACLGCAIPAAAGGYVRACQEGPVMDAELVDWGRM